MAIVFLYKMYSISLYIENALPCFVSFLCIYETIPKNNIHTKLSYIYKISVPRNKFSLGGYIQLEKSCMSK